MNAALLAVVGVSALVTPGQGQQRIDRRIAIAPDASIRVQNMVGLVRVSGWDRDSLAVSGTVPQGGGQFYLAGGGGSGAKLGVDDPLAKGPVPGSHLEVWVPTRSRVWIKTASADIHVTNVQGGVDAYSVTGSLRVGSEAGEVYAESMDGNVEIAGAPRWVRAKTATGSITLRVTGGDVTASSVSGNIVIAGSRFDRARFESVTGDIRFDGDFDRGGTFTFDSHGGTVELVVPGTVAANFAVSTVHGRVTNQLSAARPAASRGRTGTELAFEIGAGGAEVTVRTFKGDVLLRRRAESR